MPAWPTSADSRREVSCYQQLVAALKYRAVPYTPYTISPLVRIYRCILPAFQHCSSMTCTLILHSSMRGQGNHPVPLFPDISGTSQILAMPLTVTLLQHQPKGKPSIICHSRAAVAGMRLARLLSWCADMSKTPLYKTTFQNAFAQQSLQSPCKTYIAYCTAYAEHSKS